MTIFLDCTLRDGGYYNNWNFDVDISRRKRTLKNRLKNILKWMGIDTNYANYTIIR